MSTRPNHGQRRVRVTPEVLEAWLINGDAVETDLPENARFVRMYPESDEPHGCYALIFESPEWDELREAEEIPLIQPEVHKVQNYE